MHVALPWTISPLMQQFPVLLKNLQQVWQLKIIFAVAFLVAVGTSQIAPFRKVPLQQ
jgi:hypothetical protein